MHHSILMILNLFHNRRIQSLNLLNSSKTTIYKYSRYNNPRYKLESDDESGVHIFKNGVFTRTLLNIDNSKEREIPVQYIIHAYNKTTKLRYFNLRTSPKIIGIIIRPSHTMKKENQPSLTRRK